MVTFIIRWRSESIEVLKDCIKSIKNQHSNKFEIVLADLSGEDRKDNISELIKDVELSYSRSDEGITVDYLSSLTENAMGDYIQLLDASDKISVDWLYKIECEIISNPDLIIGGQIYMDEDNKLFDYNLSVQRSLNNQISKNELIKFFYQHGGEDRYITELNNKIISKKIVKKILKKMNNENVNSLFADRITVILCIIHADKINYLRDTKYIYYIKKEEVLYKADLLKLISDFKVFVDFALSEKKNNNIELDSETWEEDLFLGLANRLCRFFPEKSIYKAISELADKELTTKNGTSYFESLLTYLSESSYKYYESIKEYISDGKCQYVCFDIFDTLIERPFWFPADLFYLLNDKYNDLLNAGTSIDFSLIRIHGEQGCRKYWGGIRPSFEDVTLDEIYNYIHKFYGIRKDICDEIKKYEIELEMKYCSDRAIGRELFDFAKYCGKEIVIISDMYLPKATIENILYKNNYSGYKKIYLSNEIGLSKCSGQLYKYFLEDMKIVELNKLCFIGDNYQVDIVNAQKYGIRAFHVPKATEIFSGQNKAIYSGKFYKNIYEANGSIIDQTTVLKFIAIRCMMAVAANKFFGNPFVDFNIESDFNADSTFIGYYCAGQFLFSEACWLVEESKLNNIETIHFVSRDGYFLKKAYDKLKKVWKDSANSNYLYCSRKAVAPLFLRNENGIYELFLPPHILVQTPDNILKLLHIVVKKNIDYGKILKDNGIISSKKMNSENEFYLFTRVFKEYLYDADAAKEYYDMLKEYFGDIIHKNDVIFDVGYSGRMETALKKLLGFPVNSYYFHEHEQWALMRKHNNGFSIGSFYGFKPCCAYVLREQIFTPTHSSCVGFERKDGTIIPIFGEYRADYKEQYILSTIQKNCLSFIDDMVNIFGNDLQQLQFNRFDACIPFEYFLHYAKPFDRKIMSAIDFEDEFGSNAIFSIEDYWNKEQKTYNLFLHNLNTVDLNAGYINKSAAPPDISLLLEQMRNTVYEEEGIFRDGIWVKLYKKLNKAMPIGSKRRNIMKKIISLFIK